MGKKTHRWTNEPMVSIHLRVTESERARLLQLADAHTGGNVCEWIRQRAIGRRSILKFKRETKRAADKK